MPTAELMGFIVSRDCAVISLAHFSHFTYLRNWPWRGTAVLPPHPLLFPHCHSFFWSDYFLSYPDSFSLAHTSALPPLHTLYLSTASLSHDSATACERWVSHFVLLLLLLSSRCGLKGHLFGWDRAPCFCQECWLSASHAMCLPGTGAACRQTKRWDTLLSKSKHNTHFVMKTNGLLVMCDTCICSMHSNTVEASVQRARSNSPKKVSTTAISNYSSRSGTVIFAEIW